MTNVTDTTPNRPAIKFTDGTLSATIWKHTDKNGRTYYPVNLTRRYKDDQGNWKDTDRYLGDELLRMARLAEKAYDYALELQKQDRELAANGNTGIAQ